MSCLQFLFFGADDNHHALAFEFGQLFKFAGLFACLGEFQQHQLALVLIDDGAALEEDLDLHLAALFEEADGVVGLELEVVLIGLGSEADFLDDHLCGFRLDVLLFLLLFVEELLVSLPASSMMVLPLSTMLKNITSLAPTSVLSP